jgi:hypothetical protein
MIVRCAPEHDEFVEGSSPLYRCERSSYMMLYARTDANTIAEKADSTSFSKDQAANLAFSSSFLVPFLVIYCGSPVLITILLSVPIIDVSNSLAALTDIIMEAEDAQIECGGSEFPLRIF